ncbi:MAG TPA: hypothetical protein VFG04_08115 [Planctomycetaceae bacterium]|nr:hypothetical protein [Planctomycetaceae bacterium]
MGRPPKRASERKSEYLNVPVEKARLKTYRVAAEAGFKGNLSDFIRAACDALAAQLERDNPPEPPIP